MGVARFSGMRTGVLAGMLAVAGCGDVVADRVAFGDSVTFGYGGERGGWVSHLERDLGVSIANFGVPMEKVAQGRKRFVGPLGPLAMAQWSSEILLMHGGNDLAALFLGAKCKSACLPEDLDAEIDAIVRDVASIVDEARKHGDNVILATYWRVNAEACSSEPLVLTEEEVARANAFIDVYNEKLAAMAMARRMPVVRLDALALESDATNFYDCIHPSDAGYRQIAAAWKASLASN